MCDKIFLHKLRSLTVIPSPDGFHVKQWSINYPTSSAACVKCIPCSGRVIEEMQSYFVPNRGEETVGFRQENNRLKVFGKRVVRKTNVTQSIHRIDKSGPAKLIFRTGCSIKCAGIWDLCPLTVFCPSPFIPCRSCSWYKVWQVFCICGVS